MISLTGNLTIKESNPFNLDQLQCEKATMPVSNIVIILVSLVVQLVDGNQRIVYVSESISDNEDFFTSGDVDGNLLCCVYGNCSCNSLDHALANLTNNVMINITTDMTLSSLISASNLVNVSIIGHSNPTVNCKRAGGIHFNCCHNCIIQGITWDGCGTETEAGIKLSDSSNIVIESCSFQYSKGPNIVLSGVSGHVNISHCNFVHNNHYGGHGEAIYYSSSNVISDLQLFLAISNCNFSYNHNTLSLVYIENRMSKDNSNIIFQNIKFCHNQGVSIYVVDQNINLCEKVLFHNNTAENGVGIYVTDHSTVVFCENSVVAFKHNSADYNGGAVLLRYHSSIIFDQNSMATFNDNDATNGIIYSEVNCNVTFQGTSQVTFSNNSVQEHGSSLYSSNNCHITFTGNAKVTFINNEATADNWGEGGTIYSEYGQISYEGNSITLFRDNVAYASGGAINSRSSTITFKENSTTEFTNNTAIDVGGAICSYYCSISFEENSTTEFTNNTAIDGGAIYSNHDSISFEENSTTEFTNNTAIGGGGVICSYYCSISFEENSTTEFTNNTAKDGGAICSYYCSISFEENSTTEFTNNTAKDGGAICSYYCSISFEENSTTEFTNNTAIDGGAIYSNDDSISFEENSTTEFTNNTAIDGGAIYSYRSPITFKHISNTKFTNNVAISNGGAIYSRKITVSSKGNSHVEFNNNTATRGGAIYITDNFISFEESILIMFINNIAKDYGGAIAEDIPEIIFCNNSTITFTHNNAPFGETVYCGSNTIVTSKDNSTVIFNDVIAKWCTNMRCLPYTGQGAVTIDSNGIVMCSDQKAFTCLSENCNCKSLKHLLLGEIYDDSNIVEVHRHYTYYGNVVVNLADKAILSSVVQLRHLRNVSIIGENNFTVLCDKSYIRIFDCNDLTFQGITWIGCGAHDLKNSNYFEYPVMIVTHSSIFIQKNTFQYLFGLALHFAVFPSHFTITHCSFMNTNYRGHGAAIYVDHFILRYPYSGASIINNCDFSYNEGVKSIVYIGCTYGMSVYFNITTFYNNQGVSIYLSPNCFLHISGDIVFKNNIAENGAGIYISDHSTIVFGENSNVKFINNSVDHNGSAIFMNSHSSVTFEQNSIVTFNDNKGISGTIYSEDNSDIIFKATSQVIFNSNSVTQYGAAIYSFDNSNVTFIGSTNVTFSNNIVSTNERSRDKEFGGIIFSSTYSHISFDGNSTIVFSNNSANVGAAIFSLYKSSITFKCWSKVMFNSNVAQYCGIVTSTLLSNIVFNGKTEVTFNHNALLCTSTSNHESSAGAICTSQRTNVMCSGHSSVTFINNTAEKGGTVAFSDSNVTIEEDSTVTFNSNIAEYSNGGAFVCFNNSIVTIRGNSDTTFNNNKASQSGGAIYSYNMCKITFKDNSTSSFIKNTARDNGGAIVSNQLSDITFEGNSTIMFDGNIADSGGTFYFTNSTITFKDTSMISFNNNIALYGGAVLANDHSNITVTGNSVLVFFNNEASQSGGAGYFSSYCNVIMEGDAMVTFDSNKALWGGSLCFNDKTNFLSIENFTAFFFSNEAIVDGGAATVLTNSTFILQDNVSINFSNNHAQYGAAMFLDASAVMIKNSDKNNINFTNNIARIVGNSIYQDVADLCNRSCLTDRVVGISTEFIATPPNELQFYDPAICIDNDNDTQCNSYYVQNIMLGSDIIIPACVLDHYNHSVQSTQFSVQSDNNSNYIISGPKQVLIGCNNRFEGISITSNQVLSKSTNVSFSIKINVDHNPDWKETSITLIVELSECHPGFWQSSKSQKCECYNANDIVFCSGSSSTIKRGYWYGSVTGKPTVTFCPINYCNFSCCETSNGYYHLSPLRNDQCRSHRSGTACGSCTYGYTLSFDSTECVSIQSCTAGQTVLVILLTLTYWTIIVILVFAIMYYKVGIGYLYCVTYYYSIVDIVLSQNLQASRGLYLTVSIISSFSKITPQFLGELCLTTRMSGIDQQFIHYIHPSAVILIIVIITLLARKSPRFTAFISRGIIRVICLLLLLSYTSIASTSLLLMRSLTFLDIDKVYTYLSPDIEYFHGRHLAYGIVALLCSVSIVSGLPLLLTLQPILNKKFNFVKIKPLLDQFQGCYKDNYRCFAGYYMICRLVIMTIVIANSSNEFIVSYVLIVACGIIALIHLTVKPYNNEILNKFDGAVLQLIIFITALPLVDDFDSPVVITITFVLVMLPLIIFIALLLFLHKDNLKTIVKHLTSKSQTPNNDNDTDNSNEIPMREFNIIIDDSARQKAKVTICDMYVSKQIN